MQSKKSPKRFSIDMLKCRITRIEKGVKGDFAILKPLTKIEIGIIGSLTCTLAKISGYREARERDQVVAYNVHEVGSGWRAKEATLK